MYVPDEGVLGNPGVFGFIGDAVKKIGSVLGISSVKVSLPSPQVTVTPTAGAMQAAAAGAVAGLPGWVIPAAIGGLGLVLVLTMRGRR